jgi:hypothetical protein
MIPRHWIVWGGRCRWLGQPREGTYTDVQTTRDSGGIGDRVAKAVTVLKEGDVPTGHGDATPPRGLGETAPSGDYTTR